MEREKPPHKELIRKARARYFIYMRIARIEEQRVKLISRLRRMRFALIISGAALVALSLIDLSDFLN